MVRTRPPLSCSKPNCGSAIESLVAVKHGLLFPEKLLPSDVHTPSVGAKSGFVSSSAHATNVADAFTCVTDGWLSWNEQKRHVTLAPDVAYAPPCLTPPPS